MKVEFKNVPIKDIIQEPCPRPGKRFLESVRDQGIIQPVTLGPVDFGKYKIYVGRRRTFAADWAGHATVPAMVCEAENEQDSLFMREYITLIENNHRSSNPAADLEAVKTLMLKGLLTEEDIAKNCNMDLGRIRRITKLFNLCDEAVFLLRDGSLNEKAALRLTHLPKDKQLAVIEGAKVEGEEKVKVRSADIENAIRQHNLSAAQPAITGLESYIPPLTNPILIKFEEFASMFSTSSTASDDVAQAISTIRASLRGEVREEIRQAA